MPARPQSAVDQAQLVRIENVHGGFLYQHLYTAAVLLLQSASPNWTCVNVEHDEELEIQTLSSTRNNRADRADCGRPMKFCVEPGSEADSD